MYSFAHKNTDKETDSRFTSYLNFIRPSKLDEDTKSKHCDTVHPTDPLGLSYTTTTAAPTDHDGFYSDIFRRLHFPHLRSTSTNTSAVKKEEKEEKREKKQQEEKRHEEEEQSHATVAPIMTRANTMPTRTTTTTTTTTTTSNAMNASRETYAHPYSRRPSHLPSLSTTPSPSSSASSTPTSPLLNGVLPPIGIPRRDVPHNKCQLTRRRSSVTSPIHVKSWSHMKSPAASFLASFASPPVQEPVDEEDGDEIDDYVLDKVIGYGGFSVVRQGYCISDGRKVAVKVIKKNMMDEMDHQRVERELDIWKSLDHPHVVRIHKVLETDYAMYVVGDYCSRGNLLDYVAQNKKALSEAEAKRLFRELCEGVQYLHEHCKVCHKDLKLENILLDDDLHVKICDFGLAVYQEPGGHHTAHRPHGFCSDEEEEDEEVQEPAGGSLAYAAPEQVKSVTPLTCPKTDVWSLGVILYTLVAGHLPFMDGYELRLQQKILSGEFEIKDHFSDALQDLLKHCLDLNPASRYSVTEILKSPWLSSS
ncbi:Serine/threonine-protein kinase par-1 [Apophysomyces ossiformis]|uniref:Serine/threonine-protein kinase par-1 n=1 Tax=Apophysomyces ossiformis TaxID=679940 RepID=A0A8H7BKH3_9FUNG|nr:Serine/threonine-protein kinase par-1 [Apophysomyces ossiformis]